MFKKKLSEWAMLPPEVKVTHFYGTRLDLIHTKLDLIHIRLDLILLLVRSVGTVVYW
jgi:hypothetical protein